MKRMVVVVILLALSMFLLGLGYAGNWDDNSIPGKIFPRAGFSPIR